MFAIRPAFRRLAVLLAACFGVVTVLAGCQPVQPRATTGVAADYKLFVFSGWVQRWNPCEPIHYRVDTRAGGSLFAVWGAVSDLALATGLTFTYDGPAAYLPQPGRSDQPAPLVISFANRSGQAYGSGYLKGGDQIGYGGFYSRYQSSGSTITSYRITEGYAVIEASAFARSSERVKRDLLLHELGHAVGLDHARLASEVMYPVVGNGSPDGYTAGDLAGLSRVGRSAGCLTNWTR